MNLMLLVNLFANTETIKRVSTKVIGREMCLLVYRLNVKDLGLQQSQHLQRRKINNPILCNSYLLPTSNLP